VSEPFLAVQQPLVLFSKAAWQHEVELSLLERGQAAIFEVLIQLVPTPHQEPGLFRLVSLLSLSLTQGFCTRLLLSLICLPLLAKLALLGAHLLKASPFF
jgi:hypothetical protein